MLRASLLVIINLNIFASEAIGFYSKGKIKDSLSVIDQNIPIQKLFTERKKLYATAELLDVLEDSSHFVKVTYPTAEVLQVGDLSGIEGGAAPRHASHQNGLDADVVYLRINERPQDIKNPEWGENFVVKNGVSKNFHVERNYHLLKSIATNDQVARIFVDSLIKRELCSYANSIGDIKDKSTIEFLRKLRPASLHQTHFHIRLDCPAGDLKCEKQAVPPAGSGCSEIDILDTDEVSGKPTC